MTIRTLEQRIVDMREGACRLRAEADEMRAMARMLSLRIHRERLMEMADELDGRAQSIERELQRMEEG